MKHLYALLLITVSFVIASMMNVYPLSFALAAYRPMMLVLVLIFWAIYQPRYVGIGAAFFIGLLSDLLLDTRLGHQALCAAAMVFLVQILTLYSKRLTLTSAWIIALAALSFYRILLWILQSFVYVQIGLTGGLSFVISVLIFPLVWWLLFWLQQKISPSAF